METSRETNGHTLTGETTIAASYGPHRIAYDEREMMPAGVYVHELVLRSGWYIATSYRVMDTTALPRFMIFDDPEDSRRARRRVRAEWHRITEGQCIALAGVSG